MAYPNTVNLAAPLALISCLTACGGENSGVNSIAAPPQPVTQPTPPPPPPPLAPPPPPAGPNGLVSALPLTTLGISQSFAKDASGSFVSTGVSTAAVEFRYVAADNAYEMSLPGFENGGLKTLSYNGSYTAAGWQQVTSSYNALTLGNTAAEQNVRVTLARPPGPLNPDVTLTHTSWGMWDPKRDDAGSAPASGTTGLFVYGIHTSSGDVPISGTASYNARVIGSTTKPYTSSTSFDTDYIEGSARLVFDFAAGSLTGSMQPAICPWECIDLGRYDFTQTVYATGSGNFSGKFLVPGSTADSFFEGALIGPAATELMARWQAPYKDPASGTWHMMFGIWLGKKD